MIKVNKILKIKENESISTHGVAFAQWNCERMEHLLSAERSELQTLRIIMTKV